MHLWLEDVLGERALDWVREQNAATVAKLTDTARFTELNEDIRAVLDADDRIPLIAWHGERVYNLWKDAVHKRGLWRRTTMASYRTDNPDWETVLDLDALAAAEGENWVWQGATYLRCGPLAGEHRCLVALSRGGADAAVLREFDLDKLRFVEDGFTLPEAKSSASWIDEDTVFVGTDTGPGSMTSSGYPRQVRRWTRGTPVADAPVVFEGTADDVSVRISCDPSSGGRRAVVRQATDFFHARRYLLLGDALEELDVPTDADVDIHDEWLLIRVRTDWPAGAATHPAGTLLITRLDVYRAGDRDLQVLFTPDPHTSLSYSAWTRTGLILVLLSDVRSRLELLSPVDGEWHRTVLGSDLGQTDVWGTNKDNDEQYLLLSSGFTLPPTLRHGTLNGRGEAPEILKQGPAYFDADGLDTRQFFATSADGTQIPYFVVGRPGTAPGPTLLSGYGGFEVSRVPSYNAIVGRGWLARGGTYVVANIRGGGEYGPAWHRAALREKRPRAYEDFAAVAADLVERGITTRDQLGAEGGSNGGLLMGVMLTRYPELFGAIVCAVPLLDMQRYHLLLAGASWMAEYGDPDNPDDWAYLSQFSPYHNVRAAVPYPPTLITTSTRDDRVHPGHARKMVALLQEHGKDVTYYENIEGGHGGAADNTQLAYKWALAFEFLWRTLAP
ncbi:prolyl oligopeptidase family serine peptidase [Dactylosporangium matsuzakiense]|uniref:Prolyl oligopeptidase n=1 Tax=Dactylosporangium matsuzakiense TaxID=53360 RepID=A0A9W6KPG4_9ACTN|nr:prolyl oligopeptidase family serine peptidase [Dactylosporangium matsuzakiense]UWZ42009.1 S9 family peptidase [Dactylosporangium matsuzakiense]GLL04908.1 prolyl oligopeptidase [Dactylosporangium matsuzakiense]